MVFCVRERARENTKEEELSMSMAMSSHERSSSKPLHNFTLPYLKWGHQRHLRCMKLEDSSTTTTTLLNERPRRRSPPSSKLRKESEEEGIDAVREKIINDLKTAADKMKDKILREEVELEDEEEESSPAAAAVVVAAPWNLRTRRAACKAPPIGGAAAGKGFRIEEKKSNSSPIGSDAVGAKSPRLKEVKKERVKFAVNLTRKEIEEDFMELVGHRPPRRPKKRPRNVQKQLDNLFPGLWLTEVTVDSYKVPELADNGKS
ncbi:uncharacterized protein LOC116105962 [Pistacia vera]|uniref:uncharacterized protein LOC116105962 n=1 Tax=Pistacia vera TaxID=55513 RepID=UPI001262E2E2|nr:uncharacterized protein LOC116105962 [Pistacia vera]